MCTDFSFVRKQYRQTKKTLKQRLHTWAVEYNVTQKSLTALLLILQDEGHNDLPTDARTLLGTPKSTTIRECGNGHFFYYGLQRALEEKLEHFNDMNDIIEINLNIDGLPLAKSSQSQLWPILGQIHSNHITDPFLIGAYHGHNKPTDAQNLLEEFCTEYRNLQEEGFLFKNRNYRVIIRAIICDAPAKSFITSTKGHNAYFGCSKCMCEGDYYNHRMVFLDEEAPLRTDSNFRSRQNEEHHISISPFESLHVDMINDFPLDYMHLICLGVTKKLLHLWIKGNHISRLRATEIEALSKDITSLHKFIPLEFVRHPRGLNELDRWKATELRIFLLYLGPIILNKYLNADYLKHFCTLHVAIRILCNPEDCLHNNDYANKLLIYFVKTLKRLYGEDNVVYNIHNLIHLCQDVKKYGPLDSFSAFPFENYMQVLKKMLRKAEKPLAQLNNRLNERTTKPETDIENHSITNMPLFLKADGTKLGCTNSHKQIKFKNFQLTTKSPDNCCYLKDRSVFCIRYIGFKNKAPVVLGNRYNELCPIATYPCNSQDMNIHVSNGQTQDLEVVPITQIDVKGFKAFFNGIYYILPLLHL